MKFVKEYTGTNLVIPAAALKVSHFEEQRVGLHTLEDAVVILKGQMTAMEMLRVMKSLNQLSGELAAQLAKECGRCDRCDWNGCPYKNGDGYNICLPDDLKR